MNIPQISLNEEEPQKINSYSKKKVLKKVDLKEFEGNLLNKNSKSLKNHIIVIKKKRNRHQSDLKFEEEKIFESKNRKKIGEFVSSDEYNVFSLYRHDNDNFKFNKEVNSNNIIEKDNKQLSSLNKNKYDFSLGNLISTKENHFYNNSELDNTLSKINNSLKSFSNNMNLFRNKNDFYTNILEIGLNDSDNSQYKTDFPSSNNKVEACDMYIKKYLNKIKLESEAFKNYFPIAINFEITESIRKKNNIELLIEEQKKFTELKKINILHKRNLLTRKTFLKQEFKHLQNKYKNIFGEQIFKKSTKVISYDGFNNKDDELMIIHAENNDNPEYLKRFLKEMDYENSNKFEVNFYEFNNNISNEDNIYERFKDDFNNISGNFLIEKINECDIENNLFYEKEKINKEDSELEANIKEYDNDSNREDNPINDYPDEESDESRGMRGNKKYASDEEDDEEFFANKFNNRYDYREKIKKLENKLNKEFNSMDINSNKTKKYNYLNSCYNETESDEGHGEYDYY